MNDIKVVYQSDLLQQTQLAHAEKKKRRAILLNENFAQVPQRFINNLTRNTYVRPHKHTFQDQWELMSWLSGEVEALLFTEEGILYERLILSATQVKVLEIKPGFIHSFLTNSSGSYLEVRNCAYNPSVDREYVSWAPPEGSEEAVKFLELMRTLTFGENIRDIQSCLLERSF